MKQASLLRGGDGHESRGVRGVVDLQYPFTGRWLVQNSPANRVPSHGTTVFATSYAIDFVPVGDTHRTAPVTFGTLLRPEPPEKFPGFGRPVLAPADGTVVAVHDSEPDHAAYRGPAFTSLRLDPVAPSWGGLDRPGR